MVFGDDLVFVCCDGGLCLGWFGYDGWNLEWGVVM